MASPDGEQIPGNYSIGPNLRRTAKARRVKITGGFGTERVGHTATLLNDGWVLITGETDAKGNALGSAELYK